MKMSDDKTFYGYYDDLLVDFMENRNTDTEKRLKKINQIIIEDPYSVVKLAEIHEKYYDFYSENIEDLLYLIDVYSRINALLNQNTIADIISNFDLLVYEASRTKRMKSKAYFYFEKSLNKALIYYVEFILQYLRTNLIIMDDLGLIDQEFVDILEKYYELYPYPQGIVGAVLYGVKPTNKDLVIYTNYILKYYIK